MIKLDNKKEQKTQILEVIENAVNNSELELECLFNNPIPNNKLSNNQYEIKYTNFIALLKRYKNNSDYDVKTNSRIAITFDNNSKLLNIPVINGVKFCKKPLFNE